MARIKPPRSAELVRKLPIALTDKPTEVALWSGGLDSLAGLCNRMKQYPEKEFILFGTGSNLSVLGKQKEIESVVRQKFPYRVSLTQLPIELRYPSEHPPKNNEFRCRAFVFKVLGAVCAHLENQQELHIYENGFGAINLHYTFSELGLAHARSVNPISLYNTGQFVSKVLGSEFACLNPFLFWTKAEICNIIPEIGLAELAFNTVT